MYDHNTNQLFVRCVAEYSTAMPSCRNTSVVVLQQLVVGQMVLKDVVLREHLDVTFVTCPSVLQSDWNNT